MIKLKHLKCTNWIQPRFTPRKGLRRADKRQPVYGYRYVGSRGEGTCRTLPEGYERCGGNLTVDLAVVMDPYFGGSSPAVDLTVLCDSCGTAFLNTGLTDEDWAEELIAAGLEARKEQYEAVHKDSNSI